jgi:hypothetical protein
VAVRAQSRDAVGERWPGSTVIAGVLALFAACMTAVSYPLIWNDVPAWNILWVVGIVFTGTSTFALIWQVLRSRWSAVFGGTLEMLRLIVARKNR